MCVINGTYDIHNICLEYCMHFGSLLWCVMWTTGSPNVSITCEELSYLDKTLGVMLSHPAVSISGSHMQITSVH